MKILIVEPMNPPCRAEIEHTLENLQSVVGGDIQAVYPWDDPVALVCDEEGLLKNKPFNRQITDEVFIVGTFFICGLGEDNFTDLPDELMDKYEKLLKHPQMLVRTASGVEVLTLRG